MKPWKPSYRTSLALTLGLALIGSAPVARAQASNPCVNSEGAINNDVLQDSLVGTLDGETLQLSYGKGEINAKLLVSNEKISVPAGKIALVTVNFSPSTSTLEQIRFYTDLSEQYQPVAPSLLAMAHGNTIKLCDDNSAGSTPHTWNFGVKIGKDWYDPQIENDGSQPPPPPPPSPSTRRSDRLPIQ